ncbi:MAG: acetylxylan esterase [Planctomycetaceae bacterium]|nr:acetylxylan esterase [Planctomycetaceae bacterium]MBQ2822828.1 acetylxylan esterase [Thermoguttaceae bacterium]
MKKLLTLIFFWTITSFVLAEVTQINVDLDRESHIYSLTESAVFSISALDEKGEPAKEGTLNVILQNDFRETLHTETFDLSKGNPISISGKMNVPGFLSLTATCQKGRGLAGAAFEPEKIQPAQAMPTDFWEYWRGLQKKLRAEVPADLQLEKIDSVSNDKVTVYRISMAVFDGQRAHGFLAIPTGEGPFPVLVTVSWAGPGFGPEQTWPAKEGFAVLAMPIFPYPVGLTSDERQKQYDEFNEKLGIRYCYAGAPDREKYFFRNAYLGIDRIMDYVLERPDTDETRVGYYGTSQGGGSALILGGLNGKFTHISGNVPAICDHGGAKLNRSPGWPKLYDNVNTPEIEEMGPYFDGVNFARGITCPTRISVGFIDTTCSPSSVYAAFNVIPAKDKEMLTETHRGHATGEKSNQIMNWVKENVKKLPEK